jgi:dTDP-4-amino-4,6-dideoxygalactose transaminase
VETYNRAFGSSDFLKLPPDSPGNAWHLYLLRIVPEKLNLDRNAFSGLLQQQGIGVSMHFIPHYRFSAFKNGLETCDFPHAERAFQTTISLPIWPGMSAGHIAAVIAAVLSLGNAHYAA